MNSSLHAAKAGRAHLDPVYTKHSLDLLRRFWGCHLSLSGCLASTSCTPRRLLAFLCCRFFSSFGHAAERPVVSGFQILLAKTEAAQRRTPTAVKRALVLFYPPFLRTEVRKLPLAEYAYYQVACKLMGYGYVQTVEFIYRL